MASQGMILRNMSLVGGSTAKVVMPEQFKKSFEEGCYLLFMKWTALQLAINNEWGGSTSKEKAKALYDEVIEWFYTAKDHEMSDLEEVLDEALQLDFNVQAEDDSPYMVARSLVNMYNQVAQGDLKYVEVLKQQHDDSVSKSIKEARNVFMGEEDDDGDTSSSDEGASDLGEEDDEMMDVEESNIEEEEQQRGPVVDDDGFTVVQRRGRRR